MHGRLLTVSVCGVFLHATGSLCVGSALQVFLFRTMSLGCF